MAALPAGFAAIALDRWPQTADKYRWTAGDADRIRR